MTYLSKLLDRIPDRPLQFANQRLVLEIYFTEEPQDYLPDEMNPELWVEKVRWNAKGASGSRVVERGKYSLSDEVEALRYQTFISDVIAEVGLPGFALYGSPWTYDETLALGDREPMNASRFNEMRSKWYETHAEYYS